MKTRLFEIFTSIEGEGILYGTKTLFIRFAGCPFSCFYCDTPDALPSDSGKEYSISEACNLIDEAKKDLKNSPESVYEKITTIKNLLIKTEKLINNSS